MNPNQVRLVLCTFPTLEGARQIGTTLVEKQLAACINLLPCIESTFRWDGKTESAMEVLALFKTTRAVFPDFSATLISLHPYEVPEIIALDATEVSDAYARWVVGNVRPTF